MLEAFWGIKNVLEPRVFNMVELLSNPVLIDEKFGPEAFERVKR